jgi:hypothetical protein
MAHTQGNWYATRDPYIIGPPKWRMDLQNSGTVEAYFGSDGKFYAGAGNVRLKVATERSAVEWRCEYCGAIGVRAQRQCPACGAWRSFLYEEG